MRLQDVRKGVDQVRTLAREDPDAAHVAEDRVWFAVLEAIATGQCLDAGPEELAAEALQTTAIPFRRGFG